MVRAVLQNGAIQPLDPLPSDWHDGQKLLIDTEVSDRTEEISAWTREIEQAALAIPEEDHQSFLAALDEQKRVSKEQVRQQMSLP